MNYSILAIALAVMGACLASVGFFLMRLKFNKEIERSRAREEELARRAYETAILKEIGDRIGYSLDAVKIVDIISGSLGSLVSYSTVSHMIFDEKKEKAFFACSVQEPVSHDFIGQVKKFMLMAAAEISQSPFFEGEIDESLTGNLLDETSREKVESFFNLPIVISGKLVGLINVASKVSDLYNDENTEVLFKIARLASHEASKLQEVLESEKARLNQAVQSLADGLLMVDTKYHLVLVNGKLASMLGTVANPTLFDIANAMPGNFDLRALIEEALGGGQRAPREITVKGRTFQVISSRVVDKSTQKAMGAVVLFHDVSDARQLEKLRQDFTSMMVHELRAPLTSIRSTVSLLKSDISKMRPSEIVSHLELVDSTSFGMLEVVNDLLDVAKMEAGRFDVVCSIGNIAKVAAERVEAFRALAVGKGLKLNLTVGENLPEAYFDKVRIKQVLNNIISNSIKFTETGEVNVKVETEVVNGYPVDILISVSDTGIGIDPEEGRKLFSRFGQLIRGRRSAALKGSGLGLYIAKGIVEAQGGRIWFKSEGAGLGSTFFFTVPLAENTRASRKVPAGQLPTVSKIAQA